MLPVAGRTQSARNTRKFGCHRRKWHHRFRRNSRRIQRSLGAKTTTHFDGWHATGHRRVANFMGQQQRAKAEARGKVLAEQLGHTLRVFVALGRRACFPIVDNSLPCQKFANPPPSEAASTTLSVAALPRVVGQALLPIVVACCYQRVLVFQRSVGLARPMYKDRA